MRWTEITIEAGAGAVEAVGQALQDAGCTGFEVRSDALPPAVAGYLPVDDRLEDRLAQIQERLRALPGFGIDDVCAELTLRTVQEEDWANAWKAYFKPMRVGRHLVVTPPWETPELGPGDIPLVIDPGMAFGTGSHPTTQLCLAALEDYVTPGLSAADIGTGSGILAIAAAKLGASPVVATDIEPPSVDIAADNARVNGVTLQTQVPLPGGAFDVIVANILADVIIGLRGDLAARVNPGGALIVSGIIDTREADVRAALEAVGFTSLETRRQADWVALVFRRPASDDHIPQLEKAVQRSKAVQSRLAHEELGAVLASLDDEDLDAAVLGYVASKVGSDMARQHAIISLPPGCLAYYVTLSVDLEIPNGGYNQYFWNRGGFAAEAAQGYRTIGAVKHAALMEEAIALYQAEGETHKRFRAQDTLEAFSESYEHTALNDLDERYYALEDDTDALRAQYVRQHPEAFVAP